MENYSFSTREILNQDLKEALASYVNIFLLDVREPWEFEIAKLSNSVNIPLDQIFESHAALDKINKDQDLVVICHTGRRSMIACCWLRQYGFNNCFSLKGGIDSWSKEIDNGIPRYTK